jgi:hypothetical protein
VILENFEEYRATAADPSDRGMMIDDRGVVINQKVDVTPAAYFSCTVW